MKYRQTTRASKQCGKVLLNVLLFISLAGNLVLGAKLVSTKHIVPDPDNILVSIQSLLKDNYSSLSTLADIQRSPPRIDIVDMPTQKTEVVSTGVLNRKTCWEREGNTFKDCGAYY